MTRLTRLACEPDILLNGSLIRLRQHGTFLSFSQKIHAVNFFVKKHGVFRPAGGDIRHQTRIA
ncbi:MAG: hypothetical protein ACLFVO_14185 [Chloroflexaceae bacterium]